MNKKTNERFFSIGKSENDVRNVPAGTLVSSNIVSENYDFFLVSQFSNKGSTVPNHYKIVYTDSKMEEGLLQELIFSQCFNYVNWTGSIKVPGIMQYAKKSSKFSSEILEGRELNEELSGNLYFVWSLYGYLKSSIIIIFYYWNMDDFIFIKLYQWVLSRKSKDIKSLIVYQVLGNSPSIRKSISLVAPITFLFLIMILFILEIYINSMLRIFVLLLKKWL